MNVFTLEHTPAEIVNTFPKASDLFKIHDINFCCQGNRPLHTVLKEKQLEGEALLEELNQMYETWTAEGHVIIDWETLSLSDIVEHIQDNYHSFLQAELEPLDQFVTRVYHVHGGDHPHLIDLFSLYHDFITLAESHLEIEESQWFPLIKEFEANPQQELSVQLQEIIQQLETEHETAVDILSNMREITNGFQPPAGACNTYRLTYARLIDLEENTLQHVHVENNVLLKRLKEKYGL